MGPERPNLRAIYVARQRIAPFIRRTPLIESPCLTEHTEVPVYLKLENLQQTGSFKIRGAANRMAMLTPEQKERGVITVSSGNHGRAVSYIAASMGTEASVCLSGNVPSDKVKAVAQLGGKPIVIGNSYDEAERYSIILEQDDGLTRIPPFDDPYVIAGQGTIGVEILEDLPGVDTIVVPLSGGGLISGIAIAAKSADTGIRIVGVSMERAPVMFHSLRAGRPIEMNEEYTLAEGLAGGIGLDNRYTFRLVQRLVDETVLVSEEAIAEAMLFMLDKHHMAIEGAAAVGIAAIMHQKALHTGPNVVVVVSGGNVDTAILRKVSQELLLTDPPNQPIIMP